MTTNRLRDALLERASPVDLARAMEELLGEAAAALRAGSAKSLEALARDCAKLARTVQPTEDEHDAWRVWYGAQCMAIARLSRLALLEGMPFEVIATLGERKNLLAILGLLPGRELNLSSVAQELRRDLSQVTREVDLLVRLKLIESIKSGRQRWIRLTPMGRRAVENVAGPVLAPAEPARVPAALTVAVIPHGGDPAPLRSAFRRDGRIAVADGGDRPEGAVAVVVIPPMPRIRINWLARPTVLFIDDSDEDGRNVENVFATIELVRAQNLRAVPLQVPLASGRLPGVVDLLRRTVTFADGTTSRLRPADMPGRLTRAREQLDESMAELDGPLLNRFLGGEPLKRSNLEPVLQRGFAEGQVVPIFCGSARSGLGIDSLIDFLLAATSRVAAPIGAEAPSRPAVPVFIMKIVPADAADRVALEEALRAITEAEPELDIEHDPEGRWTTIGANREEVLYGIYRRFVGEFDLRAVISGPDVNYRVTVRRGAEGVGRIHRHHPDGAGEFADVALLVEPAAEDGDVEITGTPRGVPSMFLPAIREGIRDAVARQRDRPPLARLRVTLLAGQYHETDSSPEAFRRAAFEAMEDAFRRGDAYLLEPTVEIELIAADRDPVRVQIPASELHQWEARVAADRTQQTRMAVTAAGYQPARRHSEIAEEVAAH